MHGFSIFIDLSLFFSGAPFCRSPFSAVLFFSFFSYCFFSSLCFQKETIRDQENNTTPEKRAQTKKGIQRKKGSRKKGSRQKRGSRQRRALISLQPLFSEAVFLQFCSSLVSSCFSPSFCFQKGKTRQHKRRKNTPEKRAPGWKRASEEGLQRRGSSLWKGTSPWFPRSWKSRKKLYVMGVFNQP